jgi:ABC-type spermidine/putrescine transport system permease subunit I
MNRENPRDWELASAIAFVALVVTAVILGLMIAAGGS